MIRRHSLSIGLALACAATTSTAVAKPPQVPMPIADELPVELVLNQQELAVDVPATAEAVGMQFGLIGALIGAGIQNAQVKHAETAVVPLRNLLVDYRFNEHLEAAVRAKLASEGVSPHPSLRVMQTPWDAATANTDLATMPLHALVLTPRYSVDSNFNQLNVRLTTQLVDRTIKSNKKVKTRSVFFRNYDFHFPLTVAVPGEGVNRWVGLGADQVGAMLDQGIQQSVDMMVYDFSPEGRAEWTQKFKRQSANVAGLSYPGHAVRQTSDYVWVRNGNNFIMQTLQGYQPVLGATAVPVAPVSSAAAPVAEAPASSEAGASSAGPDAAAPAAQQQ